MKSSNFEVDMKSSGLTLGSTVIAQQNINNQMPPASDEFWAWLSSTPFDAKHIEINKTKTPNTGAWLLRHEKFRSWKREDGEILWLNGPPGSGKSFLTYEVIEEMKRDNCSHAYFYCDFALKDSLDDTSIMKSVLSQLLSSVDDSPDLKTLESEIRKNHFIGQRRSMAWSDIKKYIFRASEIHKKTTLIIDGIDECDDEVITKLIMQVYQLLRPQLIKVFLSSRQTAGICKLLAGRSSISLDDEVQSVKEDIDTFVSSSLPDQTEFAGLKMSENISEEIRADLNFRLAELRMSMIRTQVSSVEHVKQVLNRRLSNLGEEYMKSLHRIVTSSTALGPMSGEYIKSLFLWLATARRQLLIKQLETALSLSQESTETLKISPMVNLDRLLDICRDFIVVKNVTSVEGRLQNHPRDPSRKIQRRQSDDRVSALVRTTRRDRNREDLGNSENAGDDQELEEPDTRDNRLVSLAHFSVKEFLSSETLKKSELSQFYIPPFQAEKTVTLQTMKFLLLRDARISPPFNRYAEQNWICHAQNAMVALDKEIAQRRSSRPIIARIYRYILHRIWVRQSDIILEELPIYRCAEELLSNGIYHQNNYRDGYAGDLGPGTDALWVDDVGPCPLYYPVRHHLLRICRWLLDKKPELADAEIPRVGTPLLLAVENDDVKMIELLIDKGASIDKTCAARRWSKVSPIFYAAHLGHINSFNTLRNRGAVINVHAKYREEDEHTSDYETPILYDAAYRGEYGIIKELLNCDGIDINQVNGDGCTALFGATEGRHLDVMHLLMQRGINKSHRSNNGKTVLNVALEMQHHWIAKSLINAVKRDASFRVELHDHELAWTEGNTWSQDLRALQAPPLFKEFPEPLIECSSQNETTETIKQNDAPKPYAKITVKGPVRRLTICTSSHDQGWSPQLKELDGGYQGSHSFFEMRVSSSSNPTTGESSNEASIERTRRRFMVQKNIRASDEFRTHFSDFDTRNPTMTADMRDWLASLQIGDEIGIYPIAFNSPWENVVKSVKIKLWCVKDEDLQRQRIMPDAMIQTRRSCDF